MFFVDQPYVSDFFKKTVRDYDIPVVSSVVAQNMDLYPGTYLWSEEYAVQRIGQTAHPLVYTTSENALGWIFEHAECEHLAQKVRLFKNKVTFRELTHSLFPDFFFTQVRTHELATFPYDTVPLPCIIKPAVGFFSMGVYKVTHAWEWSGTISDILAEMEQVHNLYPAEVLNTGSFIIEQCINGEEFAVDAYYDSTGNPVILGILQHTFSSELDVSDRVYTTSKAIIEQNLEELTDFVGDIGQKAAVKNFPVHMELRRDKDGTLLPIEVNPLRFGGWCTTPDMTYLAYGLNPYLSYYNQQRPNWTELLKDKEGKLFSIIVLDNSTGLHADAIAAFKYDHVLSLFEKPLELRKIDYTTYPVFGFVFAETREENHEEIDNILHSSLREFVVSKG